MTEKENLDQYNKDLKQIANIINNQKNVQDAIKEVIQTSLKEDVSIQQIIKNIIKQNNLYTIINITCLNIILFCILIILLGCL